MTETIDQGDVFLMIADDLVAEALARCKRVGLRSEDGARVALGLAFAIAVAKQAEQADERTFDLCVSESLKFAATTAYASRIMNKTKLEKPR